MIKKIDKELNLSHPFQWDEATFSKLFDTYYSALCFYVEKYLGDLDLSRSIVQEVFVDIWTKRERISLKVSIKSYLYNAVRNRALDHLRKLKKNQQLSESIENDFQSPFHDRIEEAELNDRINQAINDLPEKCREVFILCRLEELKYSQVAERLDISIKTVEMQMGIALKRLRSKLSDYQYFKILISIFIKKMQ